MPKDFKKKITYKKDSSTDIFTGQQHELKKPLTKGKIRLKITATNPPKPREKTEFVTYSCYNSLISYPQKHVAILNSFILRAGWPPASSRNSGRASQVSVGKGSNRKTLLFHLLPSTLSGILRLLKLFIPHHQEAKDG
jgi:hypothetical protein